MALRGSDWEDRFGEGDLDEREFPEPGEDDDEIELVSCPNCGAEIYEEAVQCPECGEYVTHGSNVLASRPLWFVLLGLAGIVAVIWAFLS